MKDTSLIWIFGIGVAVYYGYSQSWFSSPLPAAMSSSPATAALTAGNYTGIPAAAINETTPPAPVSVAPVVPVVQTPIPHVLEPFVCAPNAMCMRPLGVV